MAWLVLLWGCSHTFDVGVSMGSDSVESPPVAVDDATPPVRWMLHGGGAEDDAVFGRFVEATGYGVIVTLGAVDDPADPDLLFWDDYFVGLGAISASTVNTATESDATAPELAEQIAAADGVFIRGGDQSKYVDWWFDGPVGEGLTAAFEAGAVIGGSSAGCAMLGERVYDARAGSVEPYELLNDSRDPLMTFSDGGAFGVPGVLTDTHHTERGRVVRLAVFQAAQDRPMDAIGVDPQTALFLRADRTGFVMGDGAVTLLRAEGEATLTAGRPPQIAATTLWSLTDGYEVDLGQADPVVRRPDDLIEPVEVATVGPFADTVLDGDLGRTALDGAWLVTPQDDPYAYVDGALRLEDGDATLPGVIIQPRLYEASELFESRVGGLLWALTQRRGAVGLGLDVGHVAGATAPASLRAAPDSALIVLDARDAGFVGAPSDGWQAAALEGVTLSILSDGASLDL